MSAAPTLASRGSTGATSRSFLNEVPLSADFPYKPLSSSARFGSLSHHSFFSRHNPHPHRVRHIQGLNGRPVCSVRDDWYVTSSLYPHPLLKSHVFRKANNPTFGFPPAQRGDGPNKSKSALFSEAWRDELKELAAKVSLRSQQQFDKEQPEEELIRRKTQYSSETGRIIPPSSKSYQRRTPSQRLLHPQAFHDQELMVLELLCQILQTDSLSSVQQWLLLASQREKDMVMGMIKQALEGVDLSGHHHHQNLAHLQAFHPGAAQPNQSWTRPQRTNSIGANRGSSADQPERIGDAEVLEVHAGPENLLQE
ncbi:protein TBATA [Antennarius striatus]|uniref:protein TBATA n=1 Tax=Antennarius striatus TaxID=241820 RepID=UPI0035B1CCCF